MNDFNKRLTEVDEILSCLPEEDLMKIPEEVRSAIKKNKDTTYEWRFNTEVPLKEQNLSKDTICFLSYINIKYLLNDEQKNLVKQILDFNEQKENDNSSVSNEHNAEGKVKEFEANKNITEETSKINNEMVQYKENIFVSFFKKIKSLFVKK